MSIHLLYSDDSNSCFSCYVQCPLLQIWGKLVMHLWCSQLKCDKCLTNSCLLLVKTPLLFKVHRHATCKQCLQCGWVPVPFQCSQLCKVSSCLDHLAASAAEIFASKCQWRLDEKRCTPDWSNVFPATPWLPLPSFALMLFRIELVERCLSIHSRVLMLISMHHTGKHCVIVITWWHHKHGNEQ